IKRRFEYKLSFKGPHLVLKDGTVPFWDHYGSAIASADSIRITPSLKSKKGSIWGKEKVTAEDWEVDVKFTVTGRGRLGADGLAVWYTTERGIEGPVFGSKDQWNGLGVFLDSFDNDGQHNNPYIMAMLNDGKQTYDHDADGSNQQLGGCLRDFRNKNKPVKIKIEYFKKVLTISFHSGMSDNEEDYDLCTRIENVNLPPNGYFGVSAATGGLADDHDVLSFSTYSLQLQTEVGTKMEMPELEKEKIEKEFQEYKEKLEKAREDFKKENPKAKLDLDVDEDKIYESPEVRSLRQIFEGQSEISQFIKSSLRKLDEIVGRQERQLSLLTSISQSRQQAGQSSSPGSTIDKKEFNQIVDAQKAATEGIKDLRQVVNDINTKFNGLKIPDQHQFTKELANHFGMMLNEFRSLSNKVNDISSNIANSPSISVYHLGFFLFIHLLTILGYFIYKAKKEAAAKKFY
ncbi:hypothetical protein HELRODRAFT_122015, partial [Helobdella robusta]|uniref:L-type lectin-like domain-containing protein n=1 Tax=Helobdella robusta TaxID=6412 RepID=T1EGT6_HELRO